MLDCVLNKLSKYSNLPDEGVEFEEPCQIKHARQYHGFHEVTHKGPLSNLMKVNPVTTPWCAGFVNAIEKKCGRSGTDQLLARSFLKYGASVKERQLGDIVVFKRGNSSWQGHVGYYISENKQGILTLGGNQNNKVCYKYYPADKLIGIRRPL